MIIVWLINGQYSSVYEPETDCKDGADKEGAGKDGASCLENFTLIEESDGSYSEPNLGNW